LETSFNFFKLNLNYVVNDQTHEEMQLIWERKKLINNTNLDNKQTTDTNLALGCLSNNTATCLIT